MRELPADLLTPVAAYLRLRERGPSFLLESIERGERVGRYSFLAAGCEVAALAAAEPDGVADGDPFAPLRAFLEPYADVDPSGLPPLAGGVVGALGYDAIHVFEPTVAPPPADPDDVHAPTRFLLAPVVVAFDHVRASVLVIALPGHEAEADEIARLLLEPAPAGAGAPVAPLAPSETVHELAQAEFEAAVRTVKEHIVRGDVFQAVPSQRAHRLTARSPFSIYRALRTVNPSPYMFLIDYADGTALVGASPETHVSLTREGRAAVLPIAGTRPRGAARAEDDALADELRADPKENAEHMMLVDLGRNDLSRVCVPGTVRPTRIAEVERYSHVMHLVARVEGDLAAGEDAFSLLRATFPAGTVSGAPKVRAMQIIADVEGRRRGVYAGAVGYVGTDGSMDFCIALRTVVVRDGLVRFQAGAGIVADSDPASEYRECRSKMAALERAVDLAEGGRYGA